MSKSCTSLTLNGHYLGYVTAGEKPLTYFQPVGGGHAVDANGNLILKLCIYTHTNKENLKCINFKGCKQKGQKIFWVRYGKITAKKALTL